MKILVTGGAGFIGTHLCRRLVADGHEVSVLDNLSPQVHGGSRGERLGGLSRFVTGDVRDRKAVADSVMGIETVYHLAAETGVGQSQYEIERYVSTNTLGTAIVAQEAGKAGVRHLIVTSSRAVYGEGMHACSECGETFLPSSREPQRLARGEWEILCTKCGALATPQMMTVGDPLSPISVYGVTKLQQEELGQQVARIFPIAVTNLRPFNVFGPGQSLDNPYVGVLGTFFRRIAAGLPIDVYEDGKMRRDFVFISDVVEALTECLGNDRAFGNTYNVCSGVPITLHEAAVKMSESMRAEPRIQVSGKFRIGDIHHALGESERAATELGFRATTSFGDGLSQYVNWARTQASADPSIDLAAEQLLKENACLGQAETSEPETA